MLGPDPGRRGVGCSVAGKAVELAKEQLAEIRWVARFGRSIKSGNYGNLRQKGRNGCVQDQQKADLKTLNSTFPNVHRET